MPPITEEKENDHKRLGQELDLFVFSDLVGSGLPLWTPRGTLLRNLLDDFVWQLRRPYGYQKVEIPHITKKDLYEKSGHWDKFQDDLFKITTREGHEFALKPMNCPHHTQIYARKLWSYRELPQRYANSTMCYRDEQTGELNGLSRTRAFTQDDAHVFCREDQVKEEFLKIWSIIEKFYGTFGFDLKIRMSFRDPEQPEKFLGDQEKWERAENILRNIVKERGAEAIDGIGEAAFYGPKLDFMAKDNLGREWQVATIQLDMNMPERFDLTCINEKGEKERIVMIHAAIMGSIERFLSILIEHYAGAFPSWLAPVQAMILPIGERHQEFAEKIVNEFQKNNIRVEIDASNESLGKRVHNAKKQKIPYLLIIGDKEVETQSVTIEQRGVGSLGVQTFSKSLEIIQKSITEKS
jgi:threonyl-tRNA synthetase